MIEPNEVINLVIASMSAVVVYSVARRHSFSRGRKALLIGYAFMLLALTVTIAEGVALATVFNMIEHLSYTASAICFALAVRWLVGAMPEAGERE